MKRRLWSLAALSAAAMAALPAGVAAQNPPPPPPFRPRPGRDYLELERRVPGDAAGGKIEVIEFFWYSCPHCNAFEPTFDAWARAVPRDVVVTRVPVAFRDDFQPQQRLFYTLEAMGKLDALHRKVFQAIHQERQPLNRDDTILAWAERQGLDRTRFSEFYQSFTVVGKLRRALQLQDAFRVEGVPALGIAGRYYTDGSLAGSTDRMLPVADALLAEVRRGR